MTRWQIVVGEYPPQVGGIGHYSRLVARSLAESGDEVHVWTPSPAVTVDAGVTVHILPDHFGPRAIAMLSRELRDGILLVQYVPHSFGWRAMNLPFCAWLHTRARKQALWVMFHEVAFPFGKDRPLRHNFLGVVTRFMAGVVARKADQIFVAIPAWEALLRQITLVTSPVSWMPVPSNIPVIDDPEESSAIRRRYLSDGGILLGHFGTFGSPIADMLAEFTPAVLEAVSSAKMLLIGKNGTRFRDAILTRHSQLAGRIEATGALGFDELSRHLSACDVMIQPYPDGVTTRRSSAMAALAHGRATITSSGALTESIWAETRAVALAPAGEVEQVASLGRSLGHDESSRRRLGRAACRLYQRHFALEHTITALREL